MAHNSQESSRKSRAAHLEKFKFQPGQSGNPGGRPKKRIVSDMIIEEITREIKGKDGANVVVLRGLVQQLVARAAKGDVNAFKELADRAEGKVLQGIEVSGTNAGPIQYEMMTEEEKDNKLAELLARQLVPKDGKRTRR